MSGPASPAGAPNGVVRRAGSAGAAVADQPAAGRAVGPGAGGAVGAVADQRAPGIRQEELVNRIQQRRHRGGLGGGVRAATGGQRLRELGMKRLRLGTERLIGLAVRAEQRKSVAAAAITSGAAITNDI